jgi:putative transposase
VRGATGNRRPYRDPSIRSLLPSTKYQRRFPGFDQKVIALYARGMSTREIQAHLRELYGVEISPELVSAVTDAVLDEVAAW